MAAPESRPFHIYRPRSAKGRKRAAALLGLDPAKVRNVRAFPVPVVAGAGRARVTLTREGLDVTYHVKGRKRRGKRRGPRQVRRTREILLEPNDLLAPRKSARLRRGDREQAKGNAVRLRTGPGHWSPIERGFMNVSGGAAYLVESYDDADEWLEAIEIVEWEV